MMRSGKRSSLAFAKACLFIRCIQVFGYTGEIKSRRLPTEA